MTITTNRKMTLEEYLTYDDGTDTRYELVDGVLVEMGAESELNVLIGGYLFASFLSIGIPHYCLRRGTEIATPDSAATSRYPDLMVLTEPAVAALSGKPRSLITVDMPPPALIVEVVSPGNEDSENYKRDYQEKPIEYANRVVPEFWQVDPDRQWIRVGTLINGTYQFVQFVGEDRIVSPTFPELTLSAEQILSAGR